MKISEILEVEFVENLPPISLTYQFLHYVQQFIVKEKKLNYIFNFLKHEQNKFLVHIKEVITKVCFVFVFCIES